LLSNLILFNQVEVKILIEFIKIQLNSVVNAFKIKKDKKVDIFLNTEAFTKNKLKCNF
jgi:hypothetical protein